MMALLPLFIPRLIAADTGSLKNMGIGSQSKGFGNELVDDESDDFDVKIESVEPCWIGLRARNWHVVNVDKVKHKTGYCKFNSEIVPAKFHNNSFVCLSPVFKNGPVRLRFSYDKEVWSDYINLEARKLPPPLQYLFAPIIAALVSVYVSYRILLKKKLIRRKRKVYHKLPAALAQPKIKNKVKKDPKEIKRRMSGSV